MTYLTKEQIKAVRVVLGLNSDLRHKQAYNPRLEYASLTTFFTDYFYSFSLDNPSNAEEKNQQIRTWIAQVLKGVTW